MIEVTTTFSIASPQSAATKEALCESDQRRKKYQAPIAPRAQTNKRASPNSASIQPFEVSGVIADGADAEVV